MTDTSANLQLPYLEPAQAQKHVTVNEALLRLDAIVQLCIVSATTTAQPSAPTDGSVYILPAGKTGAQWGSMANAALAYWRDGTWEAIAPREGWIAFVRDTDQIHVYDGAAWSQNAARAGLGLGTASLKNAGTSGDAVPLLNQINVFSGASNTFETLRIKGGFTSPNAGGTYTPGSAGANSFLYSDGVYYFDNYEGAGFDFRSASYGSLLRLSASDAIVGLNTRPSADNAKTLGSGSYRWSTMYAASGTINTSDAREKTPLGTIPDSVKRAVRRVIAQIGVFQWLEAVERKGPDRARLHVGVTAQAVRDAFVAEGESPGRWGLFCEDAVTEQVEIEPARVERATIVDPETGEDQIIETPIPALFEESPKRDAHGAPVTRLGVRTDQLMWLALAAL
jgi:hypothetical protein